MALCPFINDSCSISCVFYDDTLEYNDPKHCAVFKAADNTELILDEIQQTKALLKLIHDSK